VVPEQVIAGYEQIISQVHAHGLKVFLATILPYQGFRGWTKNGEATRQAVNEWIRKGNGYDGVIDFDRALRDPTDPARLAAEFDSGDHLHPGPAGHNAMASAIEIKLFH